MNSKQLEKKQNKKSMGKRFEVTPIKSPPLPRRLKQLNNLDGSLLFPSESSNIPYKLRKSKVSADDKQLEEKKSTSQNALLDTNVITEHLCKHLECKICTRSEFTLKTKTICGVANDVYFQCDKCGKEEVVYM